LYAVDVVQLLGLTTNESSPWTTLLYFIPKTIPL